MALLDKVKMACRVTTTAFDTELTDLISAAFADMGVTDIRPDVLTEENITPLVQRAVTTYCRMHFGQPDDYERLKASYDEQKSQLLMSGDYTDWGVI
jgi:hypothetical protein